MIWLYQILRLGSGPKEVGIILHFIISTPGSASYLLPLAQACLQEQVEYSAFFTGDGVAVLGSDAIAESLKNLTECVVCRDSWVARMGDAPCPVTLGSQTNNSALLASADHALGL